MSVVFSPRLYTEGRNPVRLVGEKFYGLIVLSDRLAGHGTDERLVHWRSSGVGGVSIGGLGTRWSTQSRDGGVDEVRATTGFTRPTRARVGVGLGAVSLTHLCSERVRKGFICVENVTQAGPSRVGGGRAGDGGSSPTSGAQRETVKQSEVLGEDERDVS